MKLEKFKEKKKINKVILTVFILLSITGGYFIGKTQSKFTYETEEIPFINGKVKLNNADIIFAFHQDGKPVDTIPDKNSGYVLDATNSKCDNDATITWDYNEWGANIRNLKKSKTKCDLYFVKPINLEDLVTSSGDGVYKVVNSLKDWEAPEYRFAGASEKVNNYISFNNEIWRIIGLVNVKTESGAIEQRLKIVRQSGIDGQKDFGFYARDKSEDFTNDWTKSKLKDMLNGSYYNSTSGECYTGDYYTYPTQSVCNFNESGLNDQAREMIDKDVIWNLGSWNNNAPTAANFYEKERGSSELTNTPAEWTKLNDPTYHNGIGLMYPSDFGYAVGGDVRESCLALNLSGYKNCKDNDWIYYGKTSGNTWLITPSYYEQNFAYDISVGNGNIGAFYTNVTRSVWPTLYLKSSYIISGGTGKIDNPYTIVKR